MMAGEAAWACRSGTEGGGEFLCQLNRLLWQRFCRGHTGKEIKWKGIPPIGPKIL